MQCIYLILRRDKVESYWKLVEFFIKKTKKQETHRHVLRALPFWRKHDYGLLVVIYWKFLVWLIFKDMHISWIKKAKFLILTP